MQSSPSSPARLLLIRHGESDWNQAQRFTGWADVGLTTDGVAQMQELGRLLLADELMPDRIFCSVLQRSTASAAVLLEALQTLHVPCSLDWRFNERHYGALTGLSKAAAVADFGAEAVRQWRRSYRAVPPPLSIGELEQFASLAHYPPAPGLPVAESLEQVCQRVLEVWRQRVLPALQPGRTIAVVAHGNSLRALVMLLGPLSESEVNALEIANGELRVYTVQPDGLMEQEKVWTPARHSISLIL